MALHAKAKTEAGFRVYALYDKIYREDILAHAFAQCRSNKGAPGVDGQDFPDIEAYGQERRLGELAIALKEDLSTSTDQTSAHPQAQRQTQAVRDIDGAGPGLHDSGDAGAGPESSRPIFPTNSTPIARAAMPSRR